MKTRWMFNRILAAVVLSSGMLVSLTLGQANKDEKPSKRAAVFMRQKLAYSQLVLEGLTLEKYDLIATNGRKMWNMSQDNLWQQLFTEEYRRFSQTYRDNVMAMVDAAREKKLDAAIQAYSKSLQCCYDCHKYFRIEQRAKLPPKKNYE